MTLGGVLSLARLSSTRTFNEEKIRQRIILPRKWGVFLAQGRVKSAHASLTPEKNLLFACYTGLISTLRDVRITFVTRQVTFEEDFDSIKLSESGR